MQNANQKIIDALGNNITELIIANKEKANN